MDQIEMTPEQMEMQMQMQAAMLQYQAAIIARFENDPDYLQAIEDAGDDDETKQDIFNSAVELAMTEMAEEAQAAEDAAEAEADAYFEAANAAAIASDPVIAALDAEAALEESMAVMGDAFDEEVEKAQADVDADAEDCFASK